MRRWSGGRWGFVLGMASASVSACSSSSGGDSHGASGAAAAGASAQQGGTGGSSASGGSSGSRASGGSDATGGTSASGGAGGQVIVGQGGTGAGSGGAQSGGAQGGGAGGAQNVFIDQIVTGQGGGPPLCFPRSVPTGLPGSANDGQASCFIAELKPGSCDCTQTARAPLPAPSLTAVETRLQQSGACGGASGVSCDTFCGCEIVQTPGVASDQSSDLYACQNEVTPAAGVNGFCMVDQMRTDASGAPAPLGNPAIVSECPSNQKRLLRFVGAGDPASGTSLFIGCTGS